jgi:hypothetical protein
MKHTFFALSVLAILTVSACANTGTWTPMSGGRTAGEGQVEQVHGKKADKTFSESLRK